MIRLSAAAEIQLLDLTEYYHALGRDTALARLRDSILAAAQRHTERRGQFLDAPRPYPRLAEHGFRWTKEGAYWIAFDETAQETVIAAIFYQSADIPSRL